MEKNCFVVNTPNAYWWFPTKDDAEIYINEVKNDYKKEDYEEEPIRFTYSKCEISEVDDNNFVEIEVIEIFIP